MDNIQYLHLTQDTFPLLTEAIDEAETEQVNKEGDTSCNDFPVYGRDVNRLCSKYSSTNK